MAPSAIWSQTAFVSAAVSANRMPGGAPQQRRAPRRAVRGARAGPGACTPRRRSRRRSATAWIGRVVAAAGWVGDRRNAISAAGDQDRGADVDPRTRWPVILAPSGSAKTTAETSSGWTTASLPMVQRDRLATKPSASTAIPASQPASHHPQQQAGVRAALGLVHAGALLQHGPEREQHRGDKARTMSIATATLCPGQRRPARRAPRRRGRPVARRRPAVAARRSARRRCPGAGSRARPRPGRLPRMNHQASAQASSSATPAASPTMATKIATPIAEPIWRDIANTAVPVANRSGGSGAVAAVGRLGSTSPTPMPPNRNPGSQSPSVRGLGADEGQRPRRSRRRR